MAGHDLLDGLDPTTTGLVVVDAQVAFADEASPLAERGVDLAGPIDALPRLRSLVDVARTADLPICYTRSVRRADDRDGPERQYGILPRIYREGEPLCRAGNPETAFAEGIEPAGDEYAVEKRRYDAFHGTPLASYLGIEGVETIVVAGFTTNVCVEGTARGAHERGFDVVVVEDATAAYSAEAHEAALHDVELALGTTATVSQVESLLAAGG